MWRPAVRLAGVAPLLIGAALLAACQTAGETPAEALPAQPATAGIRTGGGPIAGSATRASIKETSPAQVPLAAALPAPAPATAPAPAPATDSAETALATAPEQQPGPAAPVLPPAPATPALPSAPPVPHIYMSLQSGGASGEVSAVFAIDAARDHTPSDDPAVRLTPEAGLCNPQEMRSYNFPAEDAARPVVSEIEQEEGLTAGDLPAFMAVSVTDRMLERGLAREREETRALNVCTRKLWERLLVVGNQPLPALQ